MIPCVYVCACVRLAAQSNFDHMLCDGHTKKKLSHARTRVMSGFKLRFVLSWPRQLSSLCSKTPIIHLWHDSILTAPLRSKKSYSFISLHFTISSFSSPIFTPPYSHFPSGLVFILLSCLCSLFQLQFFPLNLLFLWKLLSGFDYTREAQLEENV